MCAARVPRLLAALESVTREEYWAPQLHGRGWLKARSKAFRCVYVYIICRSLELDIRGAELAVAEADPFNQVAPRIQQCLLPSTPKAFCSHHLVSVFYCAWLLRRGYNLAQVRFYKPQHLGPLR